jgi:molybdopterin/thiamine biosynthesis adenylyltransferase
LEKECGVNSRRYSRQIPLLGEEGQARLANARVAIVGLGGLGSIVSLYLAAAGVGYLRVVDGDNVEPSNLNRQILYDESSIGLPKAYMAAWRLKALNHCTTIEAVQSTLTRGNVNELIGDVDLIIDCLDNWETRLVLSSYARAMKIPLLHAAVEGYYGQLYFYKPGKSACLECIAPRSLEKRIVSVYGPAVGVVASLEASIALRFLAGEDVEGGELFIIDTREMTIDKLKIARDSCVCT